MHDSGKPFVFISRAGARFQGPKMSDHPTIISVVDGLIPQENFRIIFISKVLIVLMPISRPNQIMNAVLSHIMHSGLALYLDKKHSQSIMAVVIWVIYMR